MKLKEKISLEEFFGKEYKIRIVEPENNQEAVITHYLHNSENGVSLSGRVLYTEPLVRISQKAFPKQGLTQIAA